MIKLGITLMRHLGGMIGVSTSTGFLLLEDGTSYLLQEDGVSKFLLE